MKLLILGGTVFVGRHLVEAAQARGHEVTLFNRGRQNADLFPGVEKLRGDRDGDGLDALAGRSWDAVLDTCGYVPRVVRQSAELLAGSVSHYVFISSISVYADTRAPGVDEGSPVETVEDTTTEEIAGDTYGPLKALCEQAVQAAFPDGALILRPGFIIGPHDPTDRFTYWPHRVAQGEDVLAPGRPDQPVQVIDARDLAEWTIRLVEQGATGVYNATGPDYPLTLGEVLQTCKAVSGSDARFVWASDEFLKENEADTSSLLPFYLPAASDQGGLMATSIAKAVEAGLTFRPLADTVNDTLTWDNARPADEPRKVGLSREQERELLEKYRENFLPA
jgi:2'-hydroxyisoflavone reductase